MHLIFSFPKMQWWLSKIGLHAGSPYNGGADRVSAGALIPTLSYMVLQNVKNRKTFWILVKIGHTNSSLAKTRGPMVL